jgi:hypothetical protein
MFGREKSDDSRETGATSKGEPSTPPTTMHEEFQQGIGVTLLSAQGLIAPVNAELGSDEEEDGAKSVGEDLDENAGKLNPMVTITFGKTVLNSRRRRDTATPAWDEDFFLPSNGGNTQLVVEVFGNARIFRMDGRLGREFLGGCGARFVAEIHTRGCHWIPRMFA